MFAYQHLILVLKIQITSVNLQHTQIQNKTYFVVKKTQFQIFFLRFLTYQSDFDLVW